MNEGLFMCNDFWLQVSGTTHWQLKFQIHTRFCKVSIFREKKARVNSERQEGETGLRAPSRTNECPLYAHRNRLPFYDTYSKRAFAGHSKWAMKCNSMLNMFVSLVCLHTHLQMYTITTNEMEAENQQENGNEKPSSGVVR